MYVRHGHQVCLQFPIYLNIQEPMWGWTDSGFGRLNTHQLGTTFGSPTHLLLEVGWFSSQMGTLSSWGLRLEAGLSDDSNRDNCIHLASFVNYLGLNRGCEQKMWWVWWGIVSICQQMKSFHRSCLAKNHSTLTASLSAMCNVHAVIASRQQTVI